jgi:PAS domain S-box-containing protein
MTTEPLSWSRVAFEHAPSGQLLFSLDPRPRCLGANARARAALGLRAHGDLDGALAGAPLGDALAALDDANPTARVTLLGTSGRRHNIDLTLHGPYVLGALSQETGWRSNISLHDQNSDLLHLLIDTITSPIFVKDHEHRWILANQAFADLLGQKIEDLLGRSDYDLFPREQADVFWQKDDEVFAGGRPVGNEEALTDADGQTLWIYTQKTPVTLFDGTEALVGVITDITARKKAEEALLRSIASRDEAVQANHAKNLFIANMSHEFRTPMNSIIGYAELLVEDADLDAQSAADVGHILTAAEHLSSLIRDVLDMSVIESGELSIERTTFDASGLIDEALTICASDDSSNAFSVTCPDTLTLHTDRTKLRQILLNLISNADRFTQGGDVRVDASVQGGRPVFEVSDTGVGIAPQALTTIFDTFTQAHSGQGGTGLGLAIVQGLVHAMGAEVSVESQPGHGTTFRVTLPDDMLATADA